MIKKKMEKLSEKDVLKISTEDGEIKNNNPIYTFFNEKSVNDLEVIDLEALNVKKYLNFIYPISFIIITIMLFILVEQFMIQKKEYIVLQQENMILKNENKSIMEEFKDSKLKMDNQKQLMMIESEKDKKEHKN